MKTFTHYLSMLLMLMVALPMSAAGPEDQVQSNSFKCVDITPAAGEVKSLKEFILTFASDANPMAQVGGFKPNTKVRLYDDGDMSVAVGTLEKVSGIRNKSKAKVVLDQEVTASGDYYLYIPEGVIFDSHFDETEPDFGVSYFGATYNPTLRYDYSIKGETTYTFDPDPSVELESVPGQISLTVSKEIGTVDMALLSLGMNSQIPMEYTLAGNVLTMNLPVEEMQNIPSFSLMIYANDVDGNPLVYNDAEMIFVEYNVKVASNTFVCSEITPAEGEVESLKDFSLVFKNPANAWGDNIGGIDSSKVVLLRDSEGISHSGKISVDLDHMVSIANFSLNSAISTPGTYTLVVPEGTFYNSSYNAEDKDFGVERFGAIYNPALSFEFTIAGDSVGFAPSPADGVLPELPSTITLTFEKNVQSAEEVMIGLGMSGMLMLDASQVAIKDNTVTLTLPVDQMQNTPGFSVLLVVTDVDGKVVTYGDYDAGYVYAEYEVAVPSNTFICSDITPAEGEVESLKDFSLVFKNPANAWGDNIGGIDSSKVVLLRDNEYGMSYNCKINVDLDNMVSIANISLTEAVAEVGSYTLVIPEGTFYNSAFDSEAADYGVSNGAIYNPELIFNFVIKGDSVAVNPDPEAGILQEVPDTISFTFEKSIAEVSEAMLFLGMGDMVMLEESQISIKENVVSIALPVEQMQNISGFGVMFAATDVDGKMINFGGEEGYVSVEYEVALPANSFLCSAVSPNEGEVQSLVDFVLTFTNPGSPWGDMIGGIDSTKQVVVMDEYYTNVAYGKVTFDDESWEPVVKIVLDREVVADGVYTLYVPEGTVYNGSYDAQEPDFGVAKHGAIYNPELNFTFVVASTPALVADPDPANGIKEIPNEITFTFVDSIKSVKEVAFNMGSGYSIPVDSADVKVEGKKVTVKVPVDKIEGFAGFTVAFLAENIAGEFITYGDTKGCIKVDYDILLPANTLVCTTATPADGSEVKELTKFDLLFDAEMVGGFDEDKVIELKDKDGNVVATATPAYDFNVMNLAILTLDKKITAAGTYTLVVPEGTIYDGNYNAGEKDFGVVRNGATYNPEIVLTYTVVGAATGIENVEMLEGNVDVYNLNGVLVGHSLKNLPKGVYIVNGKKVIVK